MLDISAPSVFIVDDDEEMRRALHWLLQSVHLKVTLHASAQDFLNAYSPDQPGCLLLDVRMPDMSGLDLLDYLKARSIDIPTIIMTAYGDVPMAVGALKSGALDFVQKPFNSQEMLDKIQCAIRLDQENRAKHQKEQSLQERFAKLTPREREILEQIKNGKSSKQIARELNISARTVDVHRAHLMTKLHIHHVVDLGNLTDIQFHPKPKIP